MRNRGLPGGIGAVSHLLLSASGQTHTSTVFGNLRDESAVLQAEVQSPKLRNLRSSASQVTIS